eukprot:1700243-Pleurochrysis_carterae.AAC.1
MRTRFEQGMQLLGQEDVDGKTELMYLIVLRCGQYEECYGGAKQRDVVAGGAAGAAGVGGA